MDKWISRRQNLDGRGILAVLLTVSFLAPVSGFAQTGTLVPAVANDGLKVIVLVGEAAVHRIPLRLVTDPVVEIRDRNDFPVEGATVVFTLPAAGPGGTYGTERIFQVKSGPSGQAGAVGFSPNQLAGRFQIAVNASLGARTGQGVIHQSNSLEAIASTMEKPKSRAKKWILITGLASAALVGTLLATRGGSPPPVPPPTVVLRPGTVTVGGPR